MAYPPERDRIVVRGRWGRIEYAVCANDTMPAEEFISGLRLPEQAKLAALFVRLASEGTLLNREQFKKVDGRIFEFKRHQIRIGCFQVDRVWYLTHGFKKKSDAWRPEELNRANRIRSEHLSRLHLAG